MCYAGVTVRSIGPGSSSSSSSSSTGSPDTRRRPGTDGRQPLATSAATVTSTPAIARNGPGAADDSNGGRNVTCPPIITYDGGTTWGVAKLVSLWAAAALTLVPLGRYAVEQPDNFFRRTEQVFLLSDRYTEGEGNMTKNSIGTWGSQQLLFNWLAAPDFIAYNYLTAARTRTLSLTRKVWHTPCVAWTVRDEKKEPLALARFDAVIFERYRPEPYIRQQ